MDEKSGSIFFDNVCAYKMLPLLWYNFFGTRKKNIISNIHDGVTLSSCIFPHIYCERCKGFGAFIFYPFSHHHHQ